MAIAVLVASVTVLPTRPADAAADPAIDAQQLVYEINLARWNPAAFTERSGITLPVGLAARPPMAINPHLTNSSTFKANELADYDYFSHQSAVTGIWPNRLARDNGYALPSWWLDNANYIESIHSGSSDAFSVLGSFAASPSHRDHIFGVGTFGMGGFGDYDEVGVGRSSNLNVWVVHSAYSALANVFVTGVVYDDVNANGRMDLGEGLAGVQVVVGSKSATSNAGGGYSIGVSPGSYQVSATGMGSATTTIGSYNVGVDFVEGIGPIVRSYELCQGLEPTIFGTSANDVLYATPDRDVIDGLAGTDVVVGLGPDDVTCGITLVDTPEGEVLRLAGIDRYATAVEISQATHPDGSGVVYLASGTNFPDAVAAGPAAGAEGAPILLAAPTTIPLSTRQELVRLNPSTVVLLGGEAALTPAVADQLHTLVPTALVTRRSGPTRYETAVAISTGAFPDGASTVYIATGEDFPDAVAAAPSALTAGGPLLLVPHDRIPPAVAAELTRLAPSQIIVVGSATAVSNSVFLQLGQYATDIVRRDSGDDRYRTAIAVSTRAFPSGASTVYVAVGSNFPDALTGGAATAVDQGPILLVEPNRIPAEIVTELKRLRPTRIVIFGGISVVSSDVAGQLAALLP